MRSVAQRAARMVGREVLLSRHTARSSAGRSRFLPPFDCVRQALLERERGPPAHLIVEQAHVRDENSRLIRGRRPSAEAQKMGATDPFANAVDELSD